MPEKRTRVTLAALLALAFCAPTVWAEDEEPEWTFKWSNGFQLDYGKEFNLKFGGRIQADYTFASPDRTVEDAFGAANFDDGFEFRRARLFFEGRIYERVKFKAQYDFAGGTADFKDVWIGLELDRGELRFGHYKEYFSLEELTSSKYLAFLERSLPVGAFSPSFNSGVGFHGNNGDTVNWGVGAFYEADGFGVNNNDDQVNITGRVAFRPLYEDDGKRLVHVGVSATRKDRETGGAFRVRTRPEVHDTTRLVDTGSFAADSATIYDLELAGVFNKLWFAGEYMVADYDAPRSGDPSFGGYYVQAGYYLTDDYRRYKTSSGVFDRQKPSDPWLGKGGRGAWEIALRFSSVDLTDAGIAGGEQDDITLGLNWYPNPATRLMINFVTADVDLLGDADFVLVRWQVDF